MPFDAIKLFTLTKEIKEWFFSKIASFPFFPIQRPASHSFTCHTNCFATSDQSDVTHNLTCCISWRDMTRNEFFYSPAWPFQPIHSRTFFIFGKRKKMKRKKTAEKWTICQNLMPIDRATYWMMYLTADSFEIKQMISFFVLSMTFQPARMQFQNGKKNEKADDRRKGGRQRQRRRRVIVRWSS